MRREYLHSTEPPNGGRRRGRDRLVSKPSVVCYELSTMTGGPLRRLQELPAGLHDGLRRRFGSDEGGESGGLPVRVQSILSTMTGGPLRRLQELPAGLADHGRGRSPPTKPSSPTSSDAPAPFGSTRTNHEAPESISGRTYQATRIMRSDWMVLTANPDARSAEADQEGRTLPGLARARLRAR